MVESPDFLDPALGIPVFSLYGKVRRPTGCDARYVRRAARGPAGPRLPHLHVHHDAALRARSCGPARQVGLGARPPESDRACRRGPDAAARAGRVSSARARCRCATARRSARSAAGSSTALQLDVDYRVVEMHGWQPDAAPGFGWPLGERTWINPSPNAPNLWHGALLPRHGDARRHDAVRRARHDATARTVRRAGPRRRRTDRRACSRLAPDWLHGCRLRPVLVRADVPQARRHSSARDCRCTSTTPPTTTTPSGRGVCRRSRFKALRRAATATTTLWRDFPYEYEQRPARDRPHQRRRVRCGAGWTTRTRHRPTSTPPRSRTNAHGSSGAQRSLIYRLSARDLAVRPARRRRRHQRHRHRARCRGPRAADRALRAARPRRAHVLGEHQADPRRPALPRVLRFRAGAQVAARARDPARVPHRIIAWPLRFVLPHDAHLRPAWMIRAGLFLYDHLARAAQLAGIDGHRPAQPPGRRRRSSSATARGFVYSDGWVDDARLVVLTRWTRASTGRRVLTRTRCVRLRAKDDAGSSRSSTRDGTRETIEARAVVNAAGPWVAQFLDEATPVAARRHPRLIKGSHIVVPQAVRARLRLPVPDARRARRVRDSVRRRLHADRHDRARVQGRSGDARDRSGRDRVPAARRPIGISSVTSPSAT